MKDALILEHKTYISARRAADITGYTSDYVGQLCRAGKIESKILGRTWFVLEESLLKHKEINDQVKTNKKTAKKRKAFQAKEERREARESEFKSLLSSSFGETPNEEILKNNEQPKTYLFKYEAEQAPFIPLINKKISEDEALKSGRKISVNFVPDTFAMNRSRLMQGAHATASETSRSLIASVIVVIIFVGGIFLTQSSFDSFSKNSVAYSQASIASVSSNVIESISRIWNSTISKVASIFNSSDKSKIAEIENSAVSENKDDLGWNGIAVAPSTNSLERDELLKQRIKDSFSDEVEVYPDQSKTSGIITPVFKKATSDDFIYVLVPVQEGQN